MMDAELIIPPEWQTPKDKQCPIMMDVGVIPQGHPAAGQYVITIQAGPIRRRNDADQIAKAMKEAIGSRLGLTFES
jgi:hypothetical protein